MHQINAFNFEMCKVFFQGACPQNPIKRSEVHPPQSYEILFLFGLRQVLFCVSRDWKVTLALCVKNSVNMNYVQGIPNTLAVIYHFVCIVANYPGICNIKKMKEMCDFPHISFPTSDTFNKCFMLFYPTGCFIHIEDKRWKL